MRKNKILLLLLASFFLFEFYITDALATAGVYEARIGSSYYSTLEAAIESATAGDTVEVMADVVLEATLVVDKGITITTDGIGNHLISGSPSNNNYLINVKTAASILSGAGADSRLIIDGGNTTHSRALVCLQAANSSMRYVTLQNNISTYSGGGGLYTNKTGITVEDCIINNNRCTGEIGGGGIYLTGTAEMTICRSTVSNNSATSSGGGAFVATNGELSADYCTFSNNSADIKSGAVKVNGRFHPTHCTISNNMAPSDGGSSLLSDLPSFQGRLLGYVDGSDDQQEAVYQLTANGDTYSSYLAKMASSGYVLRRSTEIDSNTFSVLTSSSKTVTLMDTPSLKESTVRILIENTATLPNLNSPAEESVTIPTVSMLGTGSPTSQNGMCFIYQLNDGRFIVVDGGYSSDADQIYNTLKALSESNEVTIAAWILTHAHNDHVAAFVSFWESEYASCVSLEKVIYNFPGISTFSDNIITKPQEVDWMTSTEETIDTFPSSVERIKAHPGQVYCIGNATITMLYSAELIAPDEVWNFNDTSLIFAIELGGTKFLQLGDCAREAGCALMQLYSSELASDVLQVAHHGHYNNCVYSNLYEAVSAEYAFWPSTQERYNWDENRNAEANAWLFNQQQNGYLTMWCAESSIRTFQIQNHELTVLPVACIDSSFYASLDDAALAAETGDTITLIRPCTIRSSGVLINKNITLRTDGDNPCYVNGILTVSTGKTLTLSGGVSAKEIHLENSAVLNFVDAICQDKITALSLGDFANVKSAQANQRVCLTGNVSENYQKITLLDSVNPTDSTEGYMLYASGKVIKSGEAMVGNTVYSTLEQAVANASTGSTVTLIADVHLEDQLKIQKNLIFSSDGYCDRVITSDCVDGYALFVTGSANANISVQLLGIENSRLIIDGKGIMRVKSIMCSNHATTTMTNVAIRNGNSSFTGAGLYVTQGSANLNNCELAHNVTSDRGGGSYVTSTGSLTMNECQLLSNTASYGGGIYGANSSSGVSASIVISDSLIEGNCAANRGGGIYGNGDSVTCCSVTIQGSTFRQNSANTAANGAGGAICLSGPKADINVAESTFESNSASAFGGAVTTSSSNGRVTLDSCSFTANTAGGATLGGGAICCGTMIVHGGTTLMNQNLTMTSNGGAICLQNTLLTIDNGATLTLTGNTATNGLGDDVYIPANGSIAINGNVMGTINFYVADASQGSTVLSGSHVAQQYDKFTFGDGSFLIASNGTLIPAQQ